MMIAGSSWNFMAQTSHLMRDWSRKRKLQQALGLTATAADTFRDPRHGKKTPTAVGCPWFTVEPRFEPRDHSRGSILTSWNTSVARNSTSPNCLGAMNPYGKGRFRSCDGRNQVCILRAYCPWIAPGARHAGATPRDETKASDRRWEWALWRASISRRATPAPGPAPPPPAESNFLFSISYQWRDAGLFFL